MSNLAPLAGKEVKTPWRWRTSRGEFMLPSSMATEHLFYTLRMIWNHTMPPHLQVGHNIRRYKFGAFYTAEYFTNAIRSICCELSTRELKPAQLNELRMMLSVFEAHQLKLACEEVEPK